ncbi:hypothetical protein EXS62_01075 [Candidatus Kaiserbacteria bacterium]|nr:hypothetical protein [Candidatus Kaiserbacteria bacterium]
MNDSRSECNGQWIARGNSWDCQPLSITHPDQLSDECLNHPTTSCTAAENSFLDNVRSVQSTGGDRYVGQDYSCEAGFTWSNSISPAGCVPIPGYTPPTTNPAVAPAPAGSGARPTICGGGICPYTPLEPLPGVNQTGNNFAGFLNGLFKLLFTIGGMAAVVSLVYGGITYMVSEIVTDKGWAKRRMQASLWGLLLLVGAWLILNTINPQLINFSFNPVRVQVSNTGMPNVFGSSLSDGSVGTLNDSQRSAVRSALGCSFFNQGFCTTSERFLVIDPNSRDAAAIAQQFNENYCGAIFSQSAGMGYMKSLPGDVVGNSGKTVLVCSYWR